MDLGHFQPCFLIAMPELLDPNFLKAVVLLTDYNQHGASGFIINRPTRIVLKNSIVLSHGTLNPGYQTVSLHFGGPVETSKIWIVYDGKAHSNPTDSKISSGVVIARDTALLTNNEITLDPTRFRIFHGYSGWGAGQLDAEIAVSAWITCPLSSELIFDTPTDQIWQNAIKGLGFEPDKLVGHSSPFLN